MNRGSFERAYEPRWSELERQLGELEEGRPDVSFGSFPALYRQVCQHLSLARSRGYGTDLEQRLNELVLRGHQQLYRDRPGNWLRAARWLALEFPRRVRAELRLFWIATLLFLGPGLAMYTVVLLRPELVHTMMSQEQAREFSQMYQSVASIQEARPAESDFLMFGFYIFNNVGIAFRTFAGGVLAGAGSVFFLVFNGLFLGAASGYLQSQDLHGVFYPFVIGHGSFELTGIVLAGVAGLRIGAAILMPGSLKRTSALRQAAHRMLPVIVGTAGFLLAAAFVEAYWSARPTDPALRYAVGAGLWLLVAAYLSLAGRGRRSA